MTLCYDTEALMLRSMEVSPEATEHVEELYISSVYHWRGFWETFIHYVVDLVWLILINYHLYIFSALRTTFQISGKDKILSAAKRMADGNLNMD